METYRYRASSRSGQISTGQYDAANPAAVEAWLKSRDLLPLRVEQAGHPASLFRRHSGAALEGGRRAVLIGELAVLLKAGLKLDQALALVRRSSPKPDEAALLGRVLAKVQGGASFADSLKSEGRSFPAATVAVVRAGEAGGSLPLVLERLADSLERERRLREKLVGSLTYPAILTVVAIASVTVLLAVVIPAFEPMFAEAGRELPPMTRLLIQLSDILRVAAPLGLLGLGGGGMALARLGREHPARRRWDRIMLGLPVAGALLVRLDAARFCRTLGTLIGNGVQLVPALALARATLVNTELAEGIARLSAGVQQGGRLNAVLRTERRWPALMPELVQVGEDTGRLADMLLKLGEVFDGEATRACDRLATLATPLITLVLGGVVALVLAGLLSTVISVNELAM